MEVVMTGVLDTSYKLDALTGRADECGDAVLIEERDDEQRLYLIDALGHGPEAHETAVKALRYIESSNHDDLKELISNLHDYMKGSRGIVIAICQINTVENQLHFAGIGNISVKIFGHKNLSLLSRDGALGHIMPSPSEQKIPFVPGDLLIICSDGLKESFSPMRNPLVFQGSSSEIAENLFARFRKDDDASCIVVRYKK